MNSSSASCYLIWVSVGAFSQLTNSAIFAILLKLYVPHFYQSGSNLPCLSKHLSVLEIEPVSYSPLNDISVSQLTREIIFPCSNFPTVNVSKSSFPAGIMFKKFMTKITSNSRIVTFSSVHHLTIHIPQNFGADSTKIFYIGLKGEFTEANRNAVVNTVYESRPMMQDHKNPLEESNFSQGPSF